MTSGRIEVLSPAVAPMNEAVAIAAVLAVVASVFIEGWRRSPCLHVVRRVFVVVATAACAAVVTGALAAVVPGDPVARVMGEDVDEDVRAAVVKDAGFDEARSPGVRGPLAAGGRVLTGLLSTSTPLRSWRTQEPVRDLIVQRLPRTVGLGVFSVVIGVVVGLLLGALSLRKNPLIDVVIAVLSAVPRFVLGPAVVVLFALVVRALPSGGVDDGWRSWVLPVTTLALPFAAVVARHARAALQQALQSDFARSARARGANEFVVVTRHALRHALVPVVHVTALQAGVVVSGAVVVEKIFSWPGLGMLLQESLRKGDLPVVEGVVVVAAAAIAASGLVADLAAGLVDPRLRSRP